MNKFVPCLLLISPLLSCTKKSETCDNGDRKCLQGLMNKHVTRKMPYWKKFYDKPLNERVFVAPKEVIEYIDLDNRKNGFPNKPFTPTVSDSFIKDIKDAINEIPDSVKDMLKAKFAGVFLVNDLGGTGYTDCILNEQGEPIAGFVVLDFQVLQKRNANEWATWKESSPFLPDPSFAIEAIIEDKGNDNRKNAIKYILLHELGHVISVKEFFHLPWGISPNKIQNVEKYEFFYESWRIDKKNNKFISRFGTNGLPDRNKVVYYFGPKLKGNQMPKVYTDLESTDFPSLYAATHPSDDWAESFVTYVHSVLMKKPFSIKIKKDGKVVKDFSLCWGTPRCAKKEAILAKLFGKAL